MVGGASHLDCDDLGGNDDRADLRFGIVGATSIWDREEVSWDARLLEEDSWWTKKMRLGTF